MKNISIGKIERGVEVNRKSLKRGILRFCEYFPNKADKITIISTGYICIRINCL